MVLIGMALLLPLAAVETSGDTPPPAGAPDAPVRGAARFGALDALVGRWQGTVEPADGSPPGVVERTYTYVLGGMFLEARSMVTFPPAVAGTDVDLDHELQLIARDLAGDRYVARRFLPQGILSEENMTLDASGGQVVFESVELMNGAPGMQTRRTLTLEDGEQLREVFEIAMPGIGFQTYMTYHLRREG
jgi:hypothetical protein